MTLPLDAKKTIMARLRSAPGHAPVTHVLSVEIDGEVHALELTEQQERLLDLDLTEARLRRLAALRRLAGTPNHATGEER